jgi:fructose-1,6-bisphosphatase I
MGMVAEQAGGKANSGKGRVLEIKPTTLHQRIPFYVGSVNMVDTVQNFLDENPDG